MQVQILSFGVLKQWLGPATTVELPEGTTVALLLDRLAGVNLAASGPVPSDVWRSLAVSVNAEYAQPTRILHQGDEVGLLPPVSGGTDTAATPIQEANPSVVVALTREPIDPESLVKSAKRDEDGAVVVFDGIVRNNSRGRQTLHLDYEAYESMALKQMNEIASRARTQFGVHRVILVHRLGRLTVGETSVLIVVSSAHRAQAYEASRWLIDTLKKTVPIWKKETFIDGAVWADGEPFPEGLAAQQHPNPHQAAQKPDQQKSDPQEREASNAS